jgi:hypothetical protein
MNQMGVSGVFPNCLMNVTDATSEASDVEHMYASCDVLDRPEMEVLSAACLAATSFLLLHVDEASLQFDYGN